MAKTRITGIRSHTDIKSYVERLITLVYGFGVKTFYLFDLYNIVHSVWIRSKPSDFNTFANEIESLVELLFVSPTNVLLPTVSVKLTSKAKRTDIFTYSLFKVFTKYMGKDQNVDIVFGVERQLQVIDRFHGQSFDGFKAPKTKCHPEKLLID